MNSKNNESIPFFSINENQDTFLIRPIKQNISKETMVEIPHRHSYQEILYVRSGRGKQMIDGQAINIQPNTFYLIREGEVHQFIEGQDLAGYLVRFSKEFFPDDGLNTLTPFDHHLGMFGPIVIPVSGRQKKFFEQLLLQMLEEYELPEKTLKKRYILQHFVAVLVARLERLQLHTDKNKAVLSDNRDKQLFLEFNELLERHFSSQHAVSFYARQLGVRNRVLSETVRKVTGHTAKKFIINKLITEAKRKLRFSGMNLKEITYHIGFDNPAYFSRMFKEQTGQSPKMYQQSKKVP